MFGIKTRALAGATLALAAATAFSSTAMAAPKPNAMTWKTANYETTSDGATAADIAAWNTIRSQNNNAVYVSCSGCDAYNGDKPETEKRPILCFKAGTVAEPAGWAPFFSTKVSATQAVSNWKFYHNWTGGYIGLSKEYVGTTLTSQAIADAKCAADVGPGYRMAEHHDNGVGGWGLGAQLEPDGSGGSLGYFDGRLKWGHSTERNKRFWVRINDQTANLWD